MGKVIGTRKRNLPSAEAATATGLLLLLRLLLWLVHLNNSLVYFPHPVTGLDIPAAAGSPEGDHIVREGDRIVQEEDHILAEDSHRNYIQTARQHI